MDERDMTPRDAAEESTGELPLDAAEIVMGSVNRVLVTNTERIREGVLAPEIGDDTDARAYEVAEACYHLESVWRPRIQRRMCESVLWGCQKGRRMPGEALRWLASAVAPKEADRLCEAADPVEASPYGIPFTRASSADGGGWEGRDRRLLMSPYAMRDDSCLLVSLVPPDEPGMVDALLLPAAEAALDTLALPGEAGRLRAAGEFVLPGDDGRHVWDTEEASAWLGGIRSRCKDTAAGRLALVLSRRQRDKEPAPGLARSRDDLRRPLGDLDDPRRPEGREAPQRMSPECADYMKQVSLLFLSEWGPSLNELLVLAYMEAYGNDPFCGVDIQHEANEFMECLPRFIVGESPEEVARRGVSRRQLREDPHRVLFAKEETGLTWLCQNIKLPGKAIPVEVRFLEKSLQARLLETPQRDLMGDFERFAVWAGYFRSLDPALAMGFAALGVGATMPEAESLLRTMAGWARICWATTVLSCPEYGGILSRLADVSAGVAEIKQRYDEVVPTLEPVWREAFERQWEPFSAEMSEAEQSCDPAVRKEGSPRSADKGQGD